MEPPLPLAALSEHLVYPDCAIGPSRTPDCAIGACRNPWLRFRSISWPLTALSEPRPRSWLRFQERYENANALEKDALEALRHAMADADELHAAERRQERWPALTVKSNGTLAPLGAAHACHLLTGGLAALAMFR